MIICNNIRVKDERLLDGLSPADGLRWNGTIVALRIPYHSSTFNYFNYIE